MRRRLPAGAGPARPAAAAADPARKWRRPGTADSCAVAGGGRCGELRLPADLHAWLVAEAKSARRSLNSEIVHRPEVERDAAAADTESP
ncbi:hypothetical protein ACFY0G_04650 [Streptomyces sp. NPDC001552]|uniref:hypothetical protein n=1 Tax=Streptomyces sp. NPDC001552 TaxID=3364587 RepID=UPI00368B1313